MEKRQNKSLETMKKTNIFFYEDKINEEGHARVEAYKKFLHEIEPCGNTVYSNEILEIFLFLNELSYKTQLYFAGASNYNYDEVLKFIKGIIYDQSEKLLDQLDWYSHIVNPIKYRNIKNNIRNAQNPNETSRIIKNVIGNYLEKQFKEASDYIKSFEEDFSVSPFLETVNNRIRTFYFQSPFGCEWDNIPKEESGENLIKDFLENNTPDSIYSYLDKHVYKQEEAKKALSLMLYNHILSIANPQTDVEKRNFLMVGPSGCGKTEIIRALDKISPVPVLVLDGASITGPGWRGPSMGDLIFEEQSKLKGSKKGLLNNAIIVVDEADKICKKSDRDYENFDYIKQRSLLKPIEDGVIYSDNNSELLKLENAIFIFAGAFEGLFEKDPNDFSISVEKKVEAKESSDQLLADALIDFGMCVELAGRISNLIQLDKLSTEDFVYILKNYDNSAVNKAKNLYQLSNIDLKITNEAIKKAAEEANKRGLGARGADAIINKAIDSKAFDAISNNDKEIRIDKASLKD